MSPDASAPYVEDPDAYAASWRPASLLPAGDGRDGGLTFVVAVLCCFACLTALAAIASNRAAEGWRRDLRASATVQVRPRAGETPGTAAARAAEALAGVRGVSEAAAQDQAAAQKLLEPWLGRGDLPDDLPIPHLVTVELNPDHPASAAALDAALKQAGVDGEVDDQGRWLGDIERGAALARTAAVLAGLVMAAAAAAVIASATRAGLAARREVVEVLHLAGAADRFIAGLFQRRFAWLAARAGVAGALVAALVAAGGKALGGRDGFTPVLPTGWTDLLALLPCPLLAGLVAAAAARGAAMSLLRSTP